MNRSYIKGLLTGMAVMICIVTGIFLVCNFAFDGIGVYVGANTHVLGENTNKTLSKLSMLKGYIGEYYMDEVDEEALTEGIYKGVFESLEDPYSCYYTKEEYADLMESSSGTYCGIGATVTQDVETGAIYIVTPFEGGSAYDAGIVMGDRITKVAGKNVTGEDLSDVVALMKGEEGTTVEVEFYIDRKKEYETFTLERRQIEVPTVESELRDDKIGYIAVSAFEEPTDEQFIAALEDLQKQGMKCLIIDLRNNGGVILDSVVNMLDYMLPEGSTIVSTKDKNGKGEVYKAKSKTSFELPLVVLINGNTASASEVFSGAIKDYNMGTLVGTNSFGKGIVQKVIPLNDGTAMKLTTSKYYSPNGTNIHGTGIKPDVEVALDLDAKTDTQYKQALQCVKQKIAQAEKK